MKRRDFIRNVSSLVVIPGIGNMLMARNYDPGPWLTAFANAGETDLVLVLIQLKGGNDGLNTLIPLDQYAAYSNARKEVAIAQSAVLPLNGYTNCGLHPAMSPLQKRFNEGKVKNVQAVSYPSQNFSHFRSTDIWLSASDSTELITTGWAGRFIDTSYDQVDDIDSSIGVHAYLLIQRFRIDKSIIDVVLLRSFVTLPFIKQDETEVPEVQNENTTTFRNAPNPFKNETRIYFYSADEDIFIEIYDVKGVLCKTIAENSFSSGSHIIEFRADDLPAGIYYARLQRSGGSRTIAMVKKVFYTI